MTSINFDQLQKEINETENYLQFTNPIQINNSSDDQTFDFDNVNKEIIVSNHISNISVTSEMLSDSNKSMKYSNSIERENLINKLLMEHKMKLNTSSRSYLDEDNDNHTKVLNNNYDNSVENPTIPVNSTSNEDYYLSNLNFISENHDVHAIEDDDQTDNTDNIIFYASDLTAVKLDQSRQINRVSEMTSYTTTTQDDVVHNHDSLFNFPQKNDLYSYPGVEDYNIINTSRNNNNDGKYYNEDLMKTTTLGHSSELPSTATIQSQPALYNNYFNIHHANVNMDDSDSKSMDSLEFAETQAWPQANLRVTVGSSSFSHQQHYRKQQQQHQARSLDQGINISTRSRSNSAASVNRNRSTSRSRSSSGKPPLYKSSLISPTLSTTTTTTTTTTTNVAATNSNNRYLKTREKLEQEANEEFKETHKFKPTIYTKNQSLQFNNHQSTSVVVPSQRHISKRIEELHLQKERKYADLRKQKKALDDMAMAECTFTPELSKGTYEILKYKTEYDSQQPFTFRNRHSTGSDHIAGNKHTQENRVMKTSDRLYQEAEQRILQQKYIEQQVYDARMAQYTFQPDLKPHSLTSAMYDEIDKMIPKKPIHERLSDMLRAKKQYMLKLQTNIQKELDEDLTFHPKIDPNSKKIAEKKIVGNVPSSSSLSLDQRSKLLYDQQQLYHKDSPSSRITKEQESAMLLGCFHKDVGSRLLDQGRVIAKHKQDLLYERESEICESLTQAKISKGSLKIVHNTGLDSSTFEDRLELYRQREKEKEKVRITEVNNIEKEWFTPKICENSNAIISDQRPDLLLETPEMKAYRLSLQSAKDIEERRQKRVAELYGSIPFAPKIDSISKALGRSNSIEELVYNTRGQQIKSNVCKKVEAEKYQECTFQPRINELSKQLVEPTSIEDDMHFYKKYHQDYSQVHGYAEDNSSTPAAYQCPLQAMELQNLSGTYNNHHRSNSGRINMKEPEKMANDIRIYMIEKEERRRSELIAQEINELRECTFHPNISSNSSNKHHLYDNNTLTDSLSHSVAQQQQQQQQQPIVIRGLGRYLELKQLSIKQKEDAIEREKEVFNVRNVDKYRRAEDGGTIVQSFKFHTTSPRNYSKSELTTNATTTASGSSNNNLQRPTYRSSVSYLAGRPPPPLQQQYQIIPHHSQFNTPIWSV